MISVDKFVSEQESLLALERSEELAQSAALLGGLDLRELVKRGVAVHKLCVQGVKTGLFGRTVVNLGAAGKDKELPAHKVTSGKLEKVMWCCSHIHGEIVSFNPKLTWTILQDGIKV